MAVPLTGRWGDNYADQISNRYHRARINLAISLLRKSGSLTGKRVYDFGCGEGVLMRYMTAHGAVSLGCDPSAPLIRRAPNGAEIGGVECVEAQPDQSLDGLIAWNVLGLPEITADETARFWAAAQSKLKPGGFLLLTVPSKHGGTQYKPLEDPDTYASKLKSMGFTEFGRKYLGYYPRIFKWHRLSQLTGWDRIARKFGFWSRGGRVYHPWRRALVPTSWQAKRSVQIASLSRRNG